MREVVRYAELVSMDAVAIMEKRLRSFLLRTGVFNVTGGRLIRHDDRITRQVEWEVRFDSTSWTGLHRPLTVHGDADNDC